CFRPKAPCPTMMIFIRLSVRRGRVLSAAGRARHNSRYTRDTRFLCWASLGERVMSRSSSLVASAAVAAAALAAPAAAHHGFGGFDPSREIVLDGTITGIDFVNPHAYLYFDAAGADGKVTPMRCEMRAATVLRRSGWTPEMFVPGTSIHVEGNPHRDDPASCYVETMKIGDGPAVERYQQFTEAPQQAPENRRYRLAHGVVNLSGDW